MASDFPHVVGSRVLVALSGGPDSVALLHLLADPRLELRLEAAHVHHGHRGAEVATPTPPSARSCAPAAGSRSTCSGSSRSSGRRKDARPHWRRRRYQLLVDTARRRVGIPYIATAHHRDDVAEGVLMQLLRGGGPRALAGVDRVTGDGVIRPLLRFDRSAIRSWLEERGIAWRDDRSNRDLDRPRNVVRHQLLPTLETAFPAARTHLVALAGALAEDESCLATELARRARWIDPWAPDGGVPSAAIADLPRALRARWLLEQAERAGLGTVTRPQIEQLHELLDVGSPPAVTLRGRWRLRRSRGTLWLEPPDLPPPFELELTGEGTWSLPVPSWFVRVAATGSGAALFSRVVARGSELSLRSPAEKDVVGEGAHAQRLAPLLRRHLPRHLRGAWPVLVVDGRIDWVPGVWQAHDAGPTTSLVVEVSRT